MSRRKIETKGKHPLTAFSEFSDGPNHAVKSWLTHWKLIFRAAKTAPKSELELFKKVPKPKKGTVFSLLQYSMPGAGKLVPLTYFAVQSTTELLAILQGAIEDKDGSFFRKLADAIEAPEGDQDPVRAYLILRFFDISNFSQPAKQIEKITLDQLKSELLEKRGIDADARNLRRQCASLGIKLLKGKTGRPKTRT